MKYLKLFESSGMINNIIEVFREIEDKFDISLICNKEYEVVVRLPIVFHFEGSNDDSIHDTHRSLRDIRRQGNHGGKSIFYGYFKDRNKNAIEWLDGNGFSVDDYDNSIQQLVNLFSKFTFDNFPEKIMNSGSIIEFKKSHFYSIEIHGQKNYNWDNFDELLKEIQNCIFRIESIYSLNIKNGGDICYGNSILRDNLYYESIRVDWKNPIDIKKYFHKGENIQFQIVFE